MSAVVQAGRKKSNKQTHKKKKEVLMFCNSCGEQIADGAAVCSRCGAAVAGRTVQTESPHICNYLVGSILVTILCCLPFGIPAIVYASKVDGLIANGDIEGARKASSTAAMWMWISFGLGAFFGLIYLIVCVVAACAS